MAIAKRTQVLLATVAVFVISLTGLAVFSFSSVTGRGKPTTVAVSDRRAAQVSFSPERVAGKVAEKNVVVDLLAEGSDLVLGATFAMQFDPKLIAINEVNSDQGILGDATVAFDLEQGLLTLAFTPGKGVVPQGRFATLLIELVGEGTGTLELLGASSELTVLRGGLIVKQRPSSLQAVVFEVSSP